MTGLNFVWDIWKEINVEVNENPYIKKKIIVEGFSPTRKLKFYRFIGT